MEPGGSLIKTTSVQVGAGLPAMQTPRCISDTQSLPSQHRVVHCHSEKQACEVMAAIKERLEKCLLIMHSNKSKIVYCKGSKRKAIYLTTQFTFLGFTFRPSKA